MIYIINQLDFRDRPTADRMTRYTQILTLNVPASVTFHLVRICVNQQIGIHSVHHILGHFLTRYWPILKILSLAHIPAMFNKAIIKDLNTPLVCRSIFGKDMDKCSLPF